MKKLIKSIDLYGEKPQFEFSHKQPVIKTYCGSFFSLLSVMILGAFAYVEFNKMFTREKKDFSSGNYSYDLKNLGEIEMSSFNKTFDFVISVTNSNYEFDITNNPYIAVEANRAVTGWNLGPNTDITVRKCDQEELEFFFGEWAYNNGNSICIDDPDSFKLHSNWDLKEYKTPYFQIVECHNTTEAPDKCASPLEIQQFIRSSVIKASILKTVVVEGNYENQPVHDDSHFRDLANGEFYPLRVQADRLYMDTLYNYETNQNLKLINSVYMGIDKLLVDDSYIGAAKKIIEFINVKKIWKFHQEKSWY